MVDVSTASPGHMVARKDGPHPLFPPRIKKQKQSVHSIIALRTNDSGHVYRTDELYILTACVMVLYTIAVTIKHTLQEWVRIFYWLGERHGSFSFGVIVHEFPCLYHPPPLF